MPTMSSACCDDQRQVICRTSATSSFDGQKILNQEISQEKPIFQSSADFLVTDLKVVDRKRRIDEGNEKEKLPDLIEAKVEITQNSSQTLLKDRLKNALFDRQAEEDTLISSYESMLNGDSYSLMLVEGANGTGKTHLVKQTLTSRVSRQNGYFVTGKFDQLQRPEPYRAFVSAFTDFARQVVERGPEETKHVREAIMSTLGDQCRVLTSMIPALEKILGDHGDVTFNVKADDAIQRFAIIFCLFMRVVSSLEHPMVILLDDLHWADRCSLDLLSRIVSDLQNMSGVFLIATCDKNAGTPVEEKTYLSKKLLEMEQSRDVPITRLFVQNLAEKQVNRLLQHALQGSCPSIKELSEIVYRQTQGNPFYIVEFIRWLEDSNLLSFRDRSWAWDVDEIGISVDVKHISEFLADRLQHIPACHQDVLKVAACLGASVDAGSVERVLDYPVADIMLELSEKGYLIPEMIAGKFRFSHDDVQHAAYSLIADSERELFHLEVGRRLWRKLEEDEVDRYIFVLLSQMNIGKRLITREKERYAVATLCLHAGTKAAKSSAFRTAALYLTFGIELLGERGWRDHYDLTLAVFNAAAEMELCIARYDTMDALIQTVLRHARHPGDMIQARATQIYAMGMTERQQESIDLGIKILAELGETFPRILCKAHLKQEIRAIRRLLQGMSNEKILRLPKMDEREKVSSMQILNLLLLNTLLFRPRLYPFINLKMMRLTLKHGLSLMSPQAFAAYGMLCISAMDDFDSAFRFAELSLELLKILEVREYLPRVHAAVYGCIWPWKKPLRESLEPLLLAHRIGMQTGDMEYASLNGNIYLGIAIDSGVPLDVVNKAWESFQARMVSHRQEALLRMSDSCAKAVHDFMGLSHNLLAVKGDDVSYDKGEAELIQNGYEVVGANAHRMTVAYVFNDYASAYQYAKNIPTRAIWSLPPSFEIVCVSFMTGMVSLAVAESGKDRWVNVKYAKSVIRLLKKYSRLCPANCLDKKFLLEAELSFAEKKFQKAFEKYTCAIALAKDNDFLFYEALANERTARFLVARENVSEAAKYFQRSCSLYKKWGGSAKSLRLQDELDSLSSAA